MNATQIHAKLIEKKVQGWSFGVDFGRVIVDLEDGSVVLATRSEISRSGLAVLNSVMQMGPVLGLVMATRLVRVIPDAVLRVDPMPGENIDIII